mgnify:CR=1 FL=1
MMLEFKNVSFRYAVDEFPMMENLSFSVEEGDFVSIIGASGCGKSTIFRLINGLEQLQKGELTLEEAMAACDYAVITLTHDKFKEHKDLIATKPYYDCVGLMR